MVSMGTKRLRKKYSEKIYVHKFPNLNEMDWLLKREKLSVLTQENK